MPHGRREGGRPVCAGLGAALSLARWCPLGKGGAGEGRALFGATGSGDSRGTGRGGGHPPPPPPFPPTPRPRPCGLRGRWAANPAVPPAARRAARGLLGGGALLWPEGGHRAGQRRGGRAARSEPTPRGAHRHAQRAPPRFAGESASSRLLSTPLVSISRLAPPLGGADRGDSFPTDRPRPAPLSPIGPRSGLFRLVLRLLVTFREATFLWG